MAFNFSKTESRFCGMVEVGCIKMKFSFLFKRSVTVSFLSFVFNNQISKICKVVNKTRRTRFSPHLQFR